MVHRRRWVGLLLAVLVLAGSLTPPFRTLLAFPDRIAVTTEDRALLPLGLPLTVSVRADRAGIVQVNGRAVGRELATVAAEPLSIRPLAPGRVTLDLSLFGIIPFRKVTVEVFPALRVMPGGQSIGVLLRAEGVRVVAHAGVQASGDRVRYPAREAGIRVGDVILRLDGHPVDSVERVADRVHVAGSRGREVELVLRRGQKRLTASVLPVYDRRQDRYLIGVWIRDVTSGVGTLTFYEEKTRIFGALGHTVVDETTGRPMEVGDGRIVSADVLDVHRGQQGRPGEKIGAFDPKSPSLGVVDRNTAHGIVGRLERTIEHPLFERAVPVALSSQVRPGPAEIVTVVRGERLQRYDVRIERVLGNYQGGKNMIVRVTDPDLLQSAGGIVQGMSGSPILQEGRLVGAVTHVFVNDPRRGYGVFVEWMIRDSGLLDAYDRTRSLREAG